MYADTYMFNDFSDEELIGPTELARNVKATLDRAARHVVTVTRDKGDDVTLLPRVRWRRALRALNYTALALALAQSAAQRLAGETAQYPAELAWLAHLDDAAFAEFCAEFATAVRHVLRGHTEPRRVDDVLFAWEQSALAMDDPVLRERLTLAGA